jgi:hypothetical protein
MPPNPFNQPSIVSIDSFLRSSNNATNGSSQGKWSSYTITPFVPIRNVKKIQMIKAVVPNIALPLDDTKDLVFFYHKLTTANPTPVSANLRAVRLYPSLYNPPSGFTAFTKNKYVSNGTELATLLNLAASTGGDNITYNPIWLVNDITFTYNAATNQMTFKGNDATAGTSYCNAAYDSPFVRIYQQSGFMTQNLPNSTTPPQPFILNYTMNLKLGYALRYDITQPYNTGSPVLGAANIGGTGFPSTAQVPVDSFLNLVPTSAIYVFAQWAGTGGQTGQGNRNLLGVIPVTQPPFGVITYQEQGNAPYLVNVLSDIYDLTIELRTDSNTPYLLPDSCSVNVLIGLEYNNEE